MPDERELRADLIRFGRLCYARNLLVALDGNLSARMDDGNVLCTRSGCHKGLLGDDDLLVIDPGGRKLSGQGRPTSEIAMHLACYRERPDCGAVIHAHPPCAVAFTIAGESLARCVLPEVVLTLGTIPTAPYATAGTEELAERVRVLARGYDAILMDRHGAVCLGADLLEAFCRLETMEHTAMVTRTARELGRIRELPPGEARRLRRIGLERYGGPPGARSEAGPEDSCRSCSGCGRGSSPAGSGHAPMRLARVVDGRSSLAAIVEQEVMRALEDG